MIDLLSEDEKRALELSGELANLVCRVVYTPYRVAPASTSDSRLSNMKGIADNDWAELAAAFHVIQRYIMSNAAARAHPELCRPLGGLVR
jgi:hypothetical protein